MERVGEHDTEDQGDGRHHLEIDQRADADAAHLGEVAGRRNAVHDDAEHDHGNQHLDQLDEAVAERLGLHREIRPRHPDEDAEHERDDDLKEQRFENVRHG